MELHHRDTKSHARRPISFTVGIKANLPIEFVTFFFIVIIFLISHINPLQEVTSACFSHYNPGLFVTYYTIKSQSLFIVFYIWLNLCAIGYVEMHNETVMWLAENELEKSINSIVMSFFIKDANGQHNRLNPIRKYIIYKQSQHIVCLHYVLPIL